MRKLKVLLVVDYQYDFVDGTLGFDSAKELDEGIAALVEEYVKAGYIVIFTFDTHGNDYLVTQEGRRLPVEHTIKGTKGWRLYGKVGEVHDRYVNTECTIIDVNKPTFGSAGLVKVLEGMQVTGEIESITVVGVVTNMCVISNAVIAKAACPEAKIVIKKDLVDSFDKEAHQKALDIMATMQMDIE